MAPRGEFENRDRDEGTGDLPETLGLERVELFDPGSARTSVPTDMRQNADRRASADSAPLGTPGIDYDVRSIYDSRPVNAKDFNLWFEFGIQEAALDLITFRRCFAVPFGYVAVVREVTFLFEPVEVVDGTYDGTARILVDGNNVDPMVVKVVPFSAGLTNVVQTAGILWQSGQPIKTFTLADQEQFIGVDVELANDQEALQDTFQVGFYGQFLQRTNVPTQFQAANKAGSAPPKITLPPQTRGGMPRPLRSRQPFPDVPLMPRKPRR